MKYPLTFLCCLIAMLSYDQKIDLPSDTTDEKTLEEVVISANKFAERKRNVSQKIDVITSRSIATSNSQSTGDLLMNSGHVFVQKSQQGGSSPVIRGFEASRVLLVIDGIRMNNAIYRAGHLQNVITIDQNILERVEIMHGPSSTLYGSDALGGVVHLRTINPRLSDSSSVRIDGAVFARHSSINDEWTGHLHASMGGQKFGWLQSYSFSNFGDLKMGRHFHEDYPGFGSRDSFIRYENGVDQVVANNDWRIQKFSGYKQWDFLQKFLFKQNDRITHQLNLQHSNSGNIPRYDRLQDKRYLNATNGTTLRYAEWYYGPQSRTLASYEFTHKPARMFDIIRLNLNYQDIKESRVQREFQRYDRLDSRFEELRIFGLIADAFRSWGVHELTIGADAQLNNLESRAERRNILTNSATKLDSRYPDGDNRMNYLGLFAQHLAKLSGNKLVLNDGLRIQYVSLRSSIDDNSFFNLPVTEFEQDNLAITGNIALIYIPVEHFRVNLGLSSGFRNPNIDDLARVFESSTSLRRVIVPNPKLDPEYTYNIDVGMVRIIEKKVRFEAGGFFTLFRNAIVLSPYNLNGQDSIIYNGVLSAVYANYNARKGRTYGFNFKIDATWSRNISFTGTLTKIYGTFENDKGEETPQDHIPPLYGKASLNISAGSFRSEFYTIFNGWKRLKDYNLEGEDNLQYATPDGMPSWFTVNLKTQFNFTPQTAVQLGVENIFDRNYRHFASGISAPGRNFIIALRTDF